ncbi:hypothetical protein [Photobacterium sanguinicancri]|uniref:Uncharacterized protein n=1 Tax=Photobacterium sanguinicancri TaxID=875932 RepID=A0AAW7Y0X3_9GAMM|nr:hypothetical protein [Photobacterium sanguinicancri]KXI23169.1 hypothetical protein AS132_09900 [Photobacterium sanguinicancri]MDO6540973.1 hypothetical protein [Photobacterium sanguinicancri]OZS43676.1 hypothetical protein ASV53_12015 [Photobacterium sanguinicancri]
MINPNNHLPYPTRHPLEKTEKSAALDERKQRVKNHEKQQKNEQEHPPRKKPHHKGLLDIYV